MTIVINSHQDNDWEVLEYNGPINEEAEVHLQKLTESLSSKVRINLRHVSMVNSCGVRSWVNFIRDIETNRTLVFEECPSEIVMQINMIPSFRGSAQIASVLGSFICDDCGTKTSVLFKAGDNMPNSPTDEISLPTCSSCQEEMELEELEEEFFAFVSAA